MKIIILSFIISTSFIASSQKKLDTTIIYFNHDDFDSKQVLSNKKIANYFHSRKPNIVKIVGCTDTTGTVEYNQKLAKNRIQNCIAYLQLPSSTQQEIIGETDRFGELSSNRCVLIITKKESEKKVVPIVKTLDTLVLNLTFVNNQDILLPESKPVIDELFQLVDTTNYVQIQLHGHVCCGSGQQLSLDRAKRIQKYLIRHGVDATKIRSYGHSNLQPRYPETTEENQKKNRRVEVVVVVE